MIMMTIDDAISYGNFAVACRFTANIARKYEQRRKRELKCILPPLMIRQTLDFTKSLISENDENGLVSVYRGSRVAIDASEEQLEYTFISRRGDLAEITFDEDAAIYTNTYMHPVKAGTYWLPVCCLAYTIIQVSTRCRVQYFYLNNYTRRNLYSVDLKFFYHIGESSISIRNGVLREEDPSDTKILDGFRYVKTIEKIDLYMIIFQCNDRDIAVKGLEHVSKCADVINCSYELLEDWDEIKEFRVITKDTDSVFTWMLNGYFTDIKYRIIQQKEDVTTQECIDAQAKKYVANCIEMLRDLVNIGVLEPFE